MAFNSAVGRKEYTATAAQKDFTYPFKVFQNTDLKVYQTPSGQVSDDGTDLLMLTTHYTVTIDGDNGGIVTLVAGAGVNDSITLIRSLPKVRDVEYQQNGDLTSQTLNDDQDYQAYLIADQDLSVSRSLVFEESAQNVNGVVPSPASLYFLQWNAAGTQLQNVNSLNADGFLWTAADVYTKTEQDITDDAQDAAIALAIKSTNVNQTKLGSLTIGESISVTAWSFVTTTITLTVASHNSKIGDTIYVSGLLSTTNAPNGAFTVTSLTATTIVYTALEPTGTPTVSSALVKYGEMKAEGSFIGKSICTAWVVFDGTTTPPLIIDSFNIKDVVRLAGGNYEPYFETPMDNALFTGSANGALASGSANIDGGFQYERSVNKCRVTTINSTGGVAANFDIVDVIVYGGKN